MKDLWTGGPQDRDLREGRPEYRRKKKDGRKKQWQEMEGQRHEQKFITVWKGHRCLEKRTKRRNVHVCECVWRLGFGEEWDC